MHSQTIFNIENETMFKAKALELFQHQYKHNQVYRSFCNYLDCDPKGVDSLTAIPFLPIEFFKSKTVVTGINKPEITFSSSGTTGSKVSQHHVSNLLVYQRSYLKGFEHFYGPIQEYCVLALLPSYLEREGSSLIYMVEDLIQKSGHSESGFYLNEFEALKNKILQLEDSGTKVLLIGVSFALLDFVEAHELQLQNTIVMETGGMKGKRHEMIRAELHETLQNGFGVSKIHSEYGMTELLSQAYSLGNGIFEAPPWMKIFIRDAEDPLSILKERVTGGINIIDLANVNSCSFIATQDLGKVYEDGRFEILGRFDHSDIRGCNLMVL